MRSEQLLAAYMTEGDKCPFSTKRMNVILFLAKKHLLIEGCCLPPSKNVRRERDLAGYFWGWSGKVDVLVPAVLCPFRVILFCDGGGGEKISLSLQISLVFANCGPG